MLETILFLISQFIALFAATYMGVYLYNEWKI